METFSRRRSFFIPSNVCVYSTSTPNKKTVNIKNVILLWLWNNEYILVFIYSHLFYLN